MKRIALVIFFLSSMALCFSDDRALPNFFHRKSLTIPSKYIKAPTPTRTTYQFSIPPISLMNLSYWDYHIGGLTSLPVRVQTPEAGNGVYLTYMGQPSTQRYVYYSYINHDGTVVVNDRITSSTSREGYSSLDLDRESGKPIFAWHSDIDSDISLEVSFAYDYFLSNTPTMISQPAIAIDNLTDIVIGDHSNPSECIWPVVHISSSPLPDHRRVYIFSTVAMSTSMNGFPGGNVYYAYADYTPQELESDTTLEWSYASIPLLNSWDDWANEEEMRFFYHTTVVGEDGKIYIVGYHFPNVIGLVEPYLDVFVNTNYGEGEWTYYSINPDLEIPVPDQTISPYPTLEYSISQGSHNTAFITPDGHLHYPLIFGFNTPDNAYHYPLMDYIKDVDFNVADHAFLIHDLFPTGVHPNDGNPVLPWDINEDGIPDSTITPAWPYDYYNETAEDGAMTYNHNTVKFTKMNEQGMVAAVWSSSLNTKLYFENPDSFPQLAPYAGAPEIFISVYPVPSPDGPQWSLPLSLNSIDTPQMASMIPVWAYPGDYVEYLGVTSDGYKVGKLHLMFYDDNQWGIGYQGMSNLGGKVMYAALEIAWTPGIPQVGEIVGLSDPLVSPVNMQLSNFPNPFNPTTTISYDIAKTGQATLVIYNVKGQKVRNLVDETKPVGNYKVVWDGLSDNGSQVSSGVYFYRLGNNGRSITKKMVLLK